MPLSCFLIDIAAATRQSASVRYQVSHINDRCHEIDEWTAEVRTATQKAQIMLRNGLLLVENAMRDQLKVRIPSNASETLDIKWR